MTASAPDSVRMTLRSILALNPEASAEQLQSVVQFLRGRLPDAVAVDATGVRCPAPGAVHMPGALFGHLTGDAGRVPKDGCNYRAQCPGDLCRLFAADSAFRNMHPLDPESWTDLTAVLAELQACKRFRDALPGVCCPCACVS